MLTILTCKPFHIERVIQECEAISISVPDYSSLCSWMAAVVNSWFSDYCISHALAMKSV